MSFLDSSYVDMYMSSYAFWANTVSSNSALILTIIALAVVALTRLTVRTITSLQRGKKHREGKVRVLKLSSEEDVAAALAEYVADLSAKFIKENGSFSVVLSGGTLIDSLRKLLEPPYINSIDWSKWLIFFLDERVVPLNHPFSNYKLASDGFLSKVPIPESNVFAINPKLSPEQAANDYEKRLKQLVDNGKLKKSGEFANFDLMLLGMGPDGHVASLFCWHYQRFEKTKWVTFVMDSPKPPSRRITFTFPLINAASEIAMVVTGDEVADAVKTALMKTSDSCCFPLPVEKVSPVGKLTWFLDNAAASGLSR
ncbi:probable 6-phosphogluconolactonase 2 [Rutidosis leptorrhynchoides]|uniref:probable 6-phosphogluconolactonase 2 n=1 Tax=Rutidosis leptorrhynchoides TaxID=125765 RepID=UPI003A9A5909